MRPKLSIALCAGYLQAELLPVGGKGLSGLFGSLVRSRPVNKVGARTQAVARIEPAAALAHGDIATLFSRALSKLKTESGEALNGLDLDVQLGADYARVGLLVLEDKAATALASASREAYVHAWVRQMLHLDPETQVIRWQILADAHKVLVSCVDRTAFDALKDSSQEHALRFVNCRPAVLSATTRGKLDGDGSASSDPLTVVWTEAGLGTSRSGSVQLLQFDGRHLSSAWRGWVPGPSNSDELDNALEGAIKRFRAHHQVMSGAVKRLQWPSTSSAVAHVQ